MFDKALGLYEKETFPQTKLLTDLLVYAKHHYVYCSPECLILAKVVEGRGWFIHLAVGKDELKRFFEIAPFELPYVGFARPKNGRTEVKWFAWNRIKKLCTLLELKND